MTERKAVARVLGRGALALLVVGVIGSVGSISCDGLPPIPFTFNFDISLAERSVEPNEFLGDLEVEARKEITLPIPSLAELEEEAAAFQEEVPIFQSITISDVGIKEVTIRVTEGLEEIGGIERLALYYLPVGGTQDDEILIGEIVAPEEGFGETIVVTGEDVDFMQLIEDNEGAGGNPTAIIEVRGTLPASTISWTTDLTLSITVLIYL